MAPGEYLIYRAHDHQWAIQFEGRFLTKFRDKSQAIQTAITIAQAILPPEAPTSVVCEVAGGERYTLWSRTKDSYVSAA